MIIILVLLPILVLANIRGISLFGLETEYENFMCTWQHPIDWHVGMIKHLNFTHIRVPFSYDYVKKGDFSKLDEFFQSVQRHDLKVALDFHRLDNTHQSAKPYNSKVTFDDFLDAWRTILTRYSQYAALEAVDIFNEYQSDNYVEWNNLARQIVSSIETDFPKRVNYYVQGTQWGGNLQYVNLTDMFCSQRIYYSIHKYWFSDQEPLEQKWEISFGPFKPIVNVGEFGFMSNEPNQIAWVDRFINWLVSKRIFDSYFWTWTFNSGDTGGILLEDCTTVDYIKIQMLQNYWAKATS